jgi:hypothetical protein
MAQQRVHAAPPTPWRGSPRQHQYHRCGPLPRLAAPRVDR